MDSEDRSVYQWNLFTERLKKQTKTSFVPHDMYSFESFATLLKTPSAAIAISVHPKEQTHTKSKTKQCFRATPKMKIIMISASVILEEWLSN